MSYTKSTATLGLPQWVDNDFPSWLTDVNGAFKSIDDNAGTLTAGIEGVTATASNALNLATESSNKVATLSGEVESVKETATTAAETADAASTTASAAKSAADAASTTASAAKSTADEASTTASEAKSAAESASSTASAAKSTADAASSTASEAKSAAESASSTASAAKSAADTAAVDAASAMSASSNIYTDATGFYHTVSGTNGGHVTFDSGNVDVKADDNMTGLTVDSAGMLDVYDTSGVSLFNSTNVLSRIAALEASSGGGGATLYSPPTFRLNFYTYKGDNKYTGTLSVTPAFGVKLGDFVYCKCGAFFTDVVGDCYRTTITTKENGTVSPNVPYNNIRFIIHMAAFNLNLFRLYTLDYTNNNGTLTPNYNFYWYDKTGGNSSAYPMIRAILMY